MCKFSENQLVTNARICHLPTAYTDILNKYFPQVEKYFPQYHALFYQNWPDKPNDFDDIFPDSIEKLGKTKTHALYIIIILAGIQRSKEHYEKLDYPLQMWKDIMPDLRLHLRMVNDKCLLHDSSVWWSFDILSAYTIQLGRLQFQKFKFFGPVQGFRERENGKIVFLSNEGLQIKSEEINGFPISNGQTSRERISLSTRLYENFLDNSSDVINIHIPGGQKLDIDACRDSMRQVKAFYQAHNPELDIKGFICLSWLLDFRLQEYLGTSSNIVKFQQLGLLYPYPNESNEALKRVFGTYNIAGIKPKNRLQHALLDLTDRGEKLHSGAIFIDYARTDIWK